MKNKLFKILGVVAIGMFSFSSCETDACKDVECGANGTCVDGDCVCETGYEGVSCQTEQRTKFLGSYNVSEACTSGNFAYSITIATSTSGVDKVIVQNFGDFDVDLVGTITSSSISFANQTVGGGTFSGTGQISDNILTIQYSVSSGSASDACTKICTKQ